MSWRWWAFVGVAHETPRMRPSWWAYRQHVARLSAGFDQLAQTLGQALLGPVQQAAQAFSDLADTWARVAP